MRRTHIHRSSSLGAGSPEQIATAGLKRTTPGESRRYTRGPAQNITLLCIPYISATTGRSAKENRAGLALRWQQQGGRVLPCTPPRSRSEEDGSTRERRQLPKSLVLAVHATLMPIGVVENPQSPGRLHVCLSGCTRLMPQECSESASRVRLGFVAGGNSSCQDSSTAMTATNMIPREPRHVTQNQGKREAWRSSML